MGNGDWSRYLPASPVLRDGGLSCRGVGEQTGRPAMRPRRLPVHGLVFVTTGRGRFTEPPRTEAVSVAAPAVMWLFPGVEHQYGPGPGGWSEHWVLFEGTAVRSYESLRAWSRTRPVLPAGPDLAETIAPLFAALRRSTATPGRRAELSAATLTAALIGFAAEQTERPVPVPHPGGRESVVDLVVSSALAPATVADRARAAGISVEQLRRVVGEQTSLTVHELVLQTRVARAQTLLASTDLTVASVARHVGYDDPAYFSRLFTARVGVPPSAFRGQAVR